MWCGNSMAHLAGCDLEGTGFRNRCIKSCWTFLGSIKGHFLILRLSSSCLVRFPGGTGLQTPGSKNDLPGKMYNGCTEDSSARWHISSVSRRIFEGSNSVCHNSNNSKKIEAAFGMDRTQ